MHKALAQRSLAGSSATQCRPVQGSSRSAKVARVSIAPLRATTEEQVSAPAVNANGTAPVIASAKSMMDFDELSQIVKMVHETDIVELELKSKKFSLALRKREALKVEQVVQMVAAPVQAAAPAQLAPAPAPAAPAPAPAAAPAPAPAPAPVAAPVKPAAGKVEGVEMLSPMAGTFYKSPAPGEPPFVKEGDRVKKGQVVGLIEAMKLMNEIEAEVAGEVVKFVVTDKAAVAPGQVLLVIKP